MKVHVVTDKGRSIRLLFPTRLLLNNITAAIFASACKKKQVPISRAAINTMLRSILDYRKQHPDWVLVDVQSADGETVYIKL